MPISAITSAPIHATKGERQSWTSNWQRAFSPSLPWDFWRNWSTVRLEWRFGVITNTLLISVLGVAPARASASVHIVECFTTAASAVSHIAHGNVDWRLFSRLVIPGMMGGIVGAYLLASIDAGLARPFVMIYSISV